MIKYPRFNNMKKGIDNGSEKEDNVDSKHSITLLFFPVKCKVAFFLAHKSNCPVS